MKKITLLCVMLVSCIAFAQPSTNATTPPARNASDVISIYGGENNSYTNVTGVNYTPNWGQPSPYFVPNPSFDPGTGNLVLFYDELSYQGTDFAGNPQNASAMEFLHVDIWTQTGKVIKVSPINLGAGATGPGEVLVSITTSAGEWVSIDLPKSSFTDMTWNSVGQFKFETDGQAAQREDVYLDNVYFWKAPAAAGSDATLTDLKVDANTIANFSPGTTNYTVDLVVGTTAVPQLTATPTDANAQSVVITQASAVPGDGTVVVTSANGNVTSTYTVTFRAVIPNSGAPYPPNYTDHLAVISDITDNTPFTVFWEPTYIFGAQPERPDLDPSAVVNKAAKNNLAIGFGGGINNGTDVTTDVSSKDFLHFDYFIPSGVDPGSLGHQFYFDLISRNPATNQNTESFYGVGIGSGGAQAFEAIDEQMEFDQWVGVDVALSTFAARGFDVNNYFQFKIAASSDIRTQLGYFDNIYFYKADTASNSTVSNSDFRIFPNPSSDLWNIVSDSNAISTIEVFSLLGNKVSSQIVNANTAKIDNSTFASGVYLAKISTDAGSTTIKLIKQ